MVVPDVDKACERFETLGVEFVKKPNDGKSSLMMVSQTFTIHFIFNKKDLKYLCKFKLYQRVIPYFFIRDLVSTTLYGY